MKHLIYIALLLATLPALAQPVNRIKLRQLQSAPDTSLQYFVSSQGDTAEWVLVSTLGGGGSTDTLYFAGDSGTPFFRADGDTVTFAGAGIASTAVSGGTVTITATEVDGSTTNELGTVSSITAVPDTSGLSPVSGDAFINATADTLGLYSGTGWVLFYGGGGGGAETKSISQSSHGFSVGDPVVYSGGAWVAANTTADSLLHDGIVSDSTNANTFKLQQYGLLTWTGHGLTVGSYYYLQDDGSAGLSADNDGDDYDYNDLLYFILDANTILVTEQRAGVTNNIPAFYDYDTSAVSPIAIDWRGLNQRFAEVNLANFTQGDFVDLTFSNPVNGGYYKAHFTNADSVNIIWPTTAYWEDGVAADTMGVDVDQVFSMFYNGDDSRYIIEFPGASGNTNRGISFDPSDSPFVRDSTVLDSIAGLVLHLNANRETEYGNGDPVDTLRDWSGQNHFLTQSTGSAQPTYTTGVINGFPVYSFDGGDYVTRDSVGELASGQDFTVFCVSLGDNNNASGIVLETNGASDATLDNRRFAVFSNTGTSQTQAVIKTDDGAVTYSSTSGLSNGTFHTRTFKNDFTASGGTATLYVNGTSNASTAWTFTSTSYSNGALNVGVQILDGPTATNYLTGDIAEVLIFNSALSDTDRGYVEEYLVNKYGHY